MNVEILARFQFAFTIGFHYIYPPLSIGLGLILVIMEGLFLKTGNWLFFFNPFGILVSITTLALFMMHGAIYLTMKTEGRLYTKLHLLANQFTIFFVLSFFITTVYTLLYIPHQSDFFKTNPGYFVIPVIMIPAIANIPRQIKKGKYRYAFLSPASTIALLLIMVAMGVFPYLLYSPGSPANGITVQNGASSEKTLKILLIFALIGTPLVGLYTSFEFWTFKGKVKLDDMSY
jgi:cytochrome bd ubiquinol oxidase subunit II